MNDTVAQGLTVHLPFGTPEEFLLRYGAHLTRGGIYLRAKSLKPPGTPVVLDLRLEQGERVLFASAVVSWVTGAHGEGVPGMGFKFVTLDEPSRRFLEAAAEVMAHAQATEPPVPPRVGPVDSNADALSPVSSPSQTQPRLPSEDSGQLSVHGDVTEVKAPPFEPAVEPPRTGPIIGIDLGTSNARAAIVEESGAPSVLRREAQAVIPSVVALSARGRFLVGTAARGQLVTNPRWAVTGFKRLIGKAPTSPEAVETVRRQAFELVASDAGGCAVRLADRTYRIEELYALVLREVKALAEDRLKAPVNRAVISVPAWYTEAQREAVREAGTLAGLHVERLSTDPSAAALAWSHRHQHPQRVLVYDLGGGTFEASVLELKDGVYEVLSSAGDTFLGGSDFDAAIATWALSEFERLNSTSLTDRVAIQRVHEAAERAKVTLSERPEARLVVSLVTVVNQRPLDLDLTLTRSLLDKLTRPLVDRTMEMCQELLRARGLRADQIDAVIAVGGQSRAGLIDERLTVLFGKKPVTTGTPEDTVALGAALVGDSMLKQEAAAAVELLPLSIGVALPGGRFQSVIAKGATLPARKTFVLSTTKDNQSSFQLLVFQGESSRASENTYLGTFKVDQLPAAARGGVTIELSFEMDRECLLTITAREAVSNRDVSAHYATRDTPSLVKSRLKELESMTPAPLTSPSNGVLGWVRKLWGT